MVQGARRSKSNRKKWIDRFLRCVFAGLIVYPILSNFMLVEHLYLSPHPTAVTVSNFPEMFMLTTENREAHDFLLKTNSSIMTMKTTLRPSSSSSSSKQLPTIVVQLKGEMGNHMSSIAHGRGLQLWALEHYGLETDLMLRHQVVEGLNKNNNEKKDNPKWEFTSQAMKHCFPYLSHWDFSHGASWNEFDQVQALQETWLEPIVKKRMNFVNGRPSKSVIFLANQPIRDADVQDGVEEFIKAMSLPVSDRIRQQFASIQKHVWTYKKIPSLPFLYSDSLDVLTLVDHYWDHFRALFSLNPSCCGTYAPDPDESVLHFRNYATELARSSRGLEDASAHQTVKVLFGHLQPGDKVAITVGREHNEQLQAIVEAFQKDPRGLQVRVISGQTGPEDFCFLRHAQKELVGNFQSTFAFWAAILGNAKNVRLYTLDSPRLRSRHGGVRLTRERFLFNFTHPYLRHRVRLEMIPSEDLKQ